MIYLLTREILQNMNIFKENTHNFFNFLKNVINDLYKLCFQYTVHRYIRCYKIEQLKLHRSLLGVNEGGGQNSPLSRPLPNI